MVCLFHLVWNGGGGTEEVDGQKLAQDAQDLAVVVVGNQP